MTTDTDTLHPSILATCAKAREIQDRIDHLQAELHSLLQPLVNRGRFFLVGQGEAARPRIEALIGQMPVGFHRDELRLALYRETGR